MTEPNVSTLGSFLTMVLTLTILLTPKAKEMVTIAESPSGIAATAKAIDSSNISKVSSPKRGQLNPSGELMRRMIFQIMPARNVTITITKQMIPNCLDKTANFFWSGVSSSSCAVSMVAIFPTSVFMPVPMTIPSPLP